MFTEAYLRAKERSKNKKYSHHKIIPILVVVLILCVFALLTNFITDWMWFGELGYTSVFFTQLFTELKIGVPLFVVLAALMYLYLKMIRKNYFKKIISHEVTDTRRLGRITALIAVLFSAVVSGFFVTNLWFQMLQFGKSTDFKIKDPLFGIDVSFYIFKFEFLDRLNEMLIGIIILFLLVTVGYYAILLVMHSPDMYEEDEAEPIEDGRYEEVKRNRQQAQGPFRTDMLLGRILNAFSNFSSGKKNRSKSGISNTNMDRLLAIGSGHLIVMGILFFVMLAVHFFLNQFDLLHAHMGAVYGAGFTDVHVTLWVYRILTVISLIGAVLVGPLIKKKKLKELAGVPLVMIGVFVIGIAAGWLVQTTIVSPDEINKESEYLANNIEYTQYAYAIENVVTKDYKADNSLDADKISSNADTVNNIRINDYMPVKTFYNQTQSIRQYYKFNDTDVDRYYVNGEYAQTYLSVREIDEEKVNNTWINRHLKYTHGYGVAASRVNAVTTSGQPEIIVKDIPPVSSAPELALKRPEVYFGELSNDYIVINTNEDEFDYPDGQENKYTRYEGKAGIKMNLFNRIMFSLKEQSLKLLVSTNVDSDSRIVINRNITERVHKIMPYLTYEDDPYAIIANGQIYWIIDAYTTSRYYPYSEPFSGNTGETNYIRNSIKVVVDAYNGDVSYYIVDDNDPMAKTFQKIYPKLFKNMDKMPESIRAHIRYPNYLMKIQADVYGRYHMNDVKVFYQNEDIWEVGHEIYGTEERKIDPNYYVLTVPGETEAEFVSSLPYTPKSKQNMTALFMTRNDGKHYGELILYRFPKNRTIYGPLQIEAQIDQNTKISQDFSLWSQAGSKYSRGNLFIVPIGDSLLYVEPIYLEAKNTAIPEVKRVVVAYGDTIAYEPTMAEALMTLFGEEAGGKVEKPTGTPQTGENLTQGDYIRQAQKAYDDAQAALKDGDWSAYGKHMNELEQALQQLVGAAGTQTAPAKGQPADNTEDNGDTAA